MRRFLVAVVVWFVVAAWPGSAFARDQFAKQAVAVGSGGAVVSDSSVATRAGLGVLRRGGTAADAAVAVASTLGVADPFVAGIGGGGYFVYYDARTRTVYTIDGRETAPAADDANLFIDPSTGKPLPFPVAVTSGLSVGIPGTLMTWQRALDRWGRFDLATDLRPAERVARSGFPFDATLQEEDRENAFRFDQFSSTSALFLPGGQLPAAGSVMRNPDLARTYDEIGREGIGALYGGQIGADVVHTVQSLPLAPGATLVPRPGKLTVSDLAGYSTIARAPTHVAYRGYDVYSMAPSSSGGSTVGESLNILSNFDMAHMSGVQYWHHFLEATRLAFADRNRYVGDPAFVTVPLAQLLSPDFGLQRACLINPNHALTSPVAPGDPSASSGGCTPTQPVAPASPNDGASTNHLVVADRYGDVASYTNTIEELGGSGIVVPGRGFLLNNELTDFNFTPLQAGTPDPNLPAAGKRPRSSMSPTIVLHDGKPFMAVGAAGGATIITTVLQILTERIDLGMSLPDAIAAPRASQRNSATTTAEPAFIALPTTPGLEQLGQSFAVSSTSPLNPAITIPPTIGVATGLEVLGDGEVLAAGEPSRRGGGAAGVVRPDRSVIPTPRRSGRGGRGTRAG
ncbi:MAG TPA: gamma-glutamyltransferase [Solirubrobacteraceae bacterium]|nr:gamma-glutamyltransferase [Solirubrobacteraceae bacterium]